MSFWEWLCHVQESRIDLDGYFGPQCTDLVNHYLSQVKRAPVLRGNAVQFAPPQAVRGMAWASNAPFNYPHPGSVVVWGKNEVQNISEYGHCAVAVSADYRALLTMDQNWPTGHATQLVLHTYDGVVGWWW